MIIIDTITNKSFRTKEEYELFLALLKAEQKKKIIKEKNHFKNKNFRSV